MPNSFHVDAKKKKNNNNNNNNSNVNAILNLNRQIVKFQNKKHGKMQYNFIGVPRVGFS
jgi:hypothetical protein